jgi:2-iminobutanoate/2-iminopropanoate deaminase
VNAGVCSAADLELELRVHHGPLADEIFIVCRPDPDALDISAQTESVYGSLLEGLQSAGGSPEDVVREMVFFKDIRDIALFQQTRNRMIPSGNYGPASSFVGQPPVEERRLFELFAYAAIPHQEQEAVLNREMGPQRSAYRIGAHKQLFLAEIYGRPGTPEEEAYAMLCAAEELLIREGMNFHDVARTWIHLRDMEKDYAGLNSGRTRFFRERGIGLRPASTGIAGTPCAEGHRFALSLFAAVPSARISLERMSAPSLNEAWIYGSDFSRGVKMVGHNGVTLFISGTASVDESGKTAHVGDFQAQAQRMILNVSNLLAAQNASFRDVVSAITYLKHAEDASLLKSVWAERGLSGIPNLLLKANVCRPDLLCEMEAIAVL